MSTTAPWTIWFAGDLQRLSGWTELERVVREGNPIMRHQIVVISILTITTMNPYVPHLQLDWVEWRCFDFEYEIKFLSWISWTPTRDDGLIHWVTCWSVWREVRGLCRPATFVLIWFGSSIFSILPLGDTIWWLMVRDKSTIHCPFSVFDYDFPIKSLSLLLSLSRQSVRVQLVIVTWSHFRCEMCGLLSIKRWLNFHAHFKVHGGTE